MALHYQTEDPIVLGSGELYLGLFSNIADPSNLTEAEKDALVNVGAVDSGANISMKKNFIEVKFANRSAVKRIFTDSTISFKSGIATFILKNLAQFITGSEYTVNAAEKTRKLFIGDNDNPPEIYLRFIHTDSKTGKQLIFNLFCGQGIAAQSFDFTKDKVTLINYEFGSSSVKLPNSKIGYAELYEVDPAMINPAVLTITSIAGTTTGTTDITVSPTLTAGNSYKYIIATESLIPELDQDVANWTAWDGTSDITAETGKYITIAEVTTLNKVVAAGSKIITSKV